MLASAQVPAPMIPVSPTRPTGFPVIPPVDVAAATEDREVLDRCGLLLARLLAEALPSVAQQESAAAVQIQSRYRRMVGRKTVETPKPYEFIGVMIMMLKNTVELYGF